MIKDSDLNKNEKNNKKGTHCTIESPQVPLHKYLLYK